MEERRRRLLQLLRTAHGILGQEGRPAERLGSRPLPRGGGLVVDLLGQVRHPLPVGLRREMLPARERREGHGLADGEPERVGVLPPETPGDVLLGPVVPGAGQRLSFHDLMDAVETGPLPEVGDQILLGPVAEDIAEPPGLRLLLVADHDRLVAPIPDLPVQPVFRLTSLAKFELK